MQDINQGTQTVGQWMLTLLLTFIPLVNIVALLIWAFSSSTHPEKSNWAKATLIWFAIIFGISLLLGLLGLGAGSGL